MAATEHDGVTAEGTFTATDPEVMTELAGLVASGDLQGLIAATYPLDQVRAAFTELEQRHTRGKIVLLP